MTYRLLLPALALTLAACGGSTGPTSATPAKPTSPTGDPSCPVEVAGTTVRVEDTDGGAALVFTSTGDLVELRTRASAMAAMHNERRGMVRTDSEARAEEIVGGARIVFTGADAAALRAELRMHAEHLGAGTCAMDHTAHAPAPTPAPAPDPEPTPVPAPPPPVDHAAVELAAYQAAKPVLDKYCTSCHVKGERGAKKSALRHLDMTSYPFGGKDAGKAGAEIREVLGATGKKPTMPEKNPGVVKGEELALILAWADAFDAARAAEKTGAP